MSSCESYLMKKTKCLTRMYSQLGLVLLSSIIPVVAHGNQCQPDGDTSRDKDQEVSPEGEF